MVRAPTPVTSFLNFPSNHRPSGLPERKRVTLRFAFTRPLEKIAGEAFASYTFRGNSVYDPDYDGVGHQPRFHDQLSPLYNKYYVHGSAINVCYNNPDNADKRYNVALIAQPFTAAIGKTPYYGITNAQLIGTSSIGSPERTCEVPKIKVLQASNPFYNAPGVLKSKAKTSTILDTKNQSKEDFWGVAGNTGTGTNPNNVWLWTVVCGATDASTLAGTIGRIHGYIDYDVTFFQPYAAGSS